MSARVAKNAASGIHFALKDAESTRYYKVESEKTMNKVRTQSIIYEGEMSGMVEYKELL